MSSADALTLLHYSDRHFTHNPDGGEGVFDGPQAEAQQADL